jgi:NADP-dependent 3-hydroxy acid dehydrogenase YdfG
MALENRTVVVTGASGHVGWGIAHAARDAGGRLVLPVRRRDAKEALEREFGARDVFVPMVDFDDESSMTLAWGQARERFGAVDHVATPLGAWWQKGNSLAQEDAELRDLLNTFVETPFRLLRTVAPHLATSRGSFTFVTGVAGEAPTTPASNLLVAAMGGLFSLSRVLRRELDGELFRVHARRFSCKQDSPNAHQCHRVRRRRAADVAMKPPFEVLAIANPKPERKRCGPTPCCSATSRASAGRPPCRPMRMAPLAPAPPAASHLRDESAPSPPRPQSSQLRLRGDGIARTGDREPGARAGEQRRRRGVKNNPPPKCPKCGGASIPILYGHPDSGGFEAAERGEVTLGGCTIDLDDQGKPTNRAWSCSKCGHEHGRIEWKMKARKQSPKRCARRFFAHVVVRAPPGPDEGRRKIFDRSED